MVIVLPVWSICHNVSRGLESDREDNILDAGAAIRDSNSKGTCSFMVASSLSQVRSPAASSNSGVGGRVHVSLESENSHVELMGGVPGGEFGCEMASKTSS